MSFKENMVDLENGKYFGWLGSECFTVESLSRVSPGRPRPETREFRPWGVG